MILSKNKRRNKRITRKTKKCKFCNKCHSKENNCYVSKGSKIGGAGIHLAYTYIILNKSVLVKYENFNNLVVKNINKSINYASHDFKETYKKYLNFLLGSDKYEVEILICMKYNDIDSIYRKGIFDTDSKTITECDLLDKEDFLSKILGHAFLIIKKSNNMPEHLFGPDQGVLQIENMCLYNRGDDKSNQDNSFLTGDYATVLATNVIIACSTNFVNHDLYPIRIIQHIDNPHFEEIIKNYTLNGLGNPSIKNFKSENSDDEKMIVMMEFIKETNTKNSILDSNTTDNFEKKAINLYKIYISSYPDTINIVFDKSCFNIFRLLCYAGREYGITRIENDDIVEYGGNLTLLKKNEKGQYILSISDLITGDFETVSFPDLSPYTYHTHPFRLYIKNKLLIGTPSGTDMAHVANRSLNYYVTKRNNDILGDFHFVIAVEGIYLVKFDFINYFKKIKEIHENTTEEEFIDELNKLVEDDTKKNAFNQIFYQLEYPFEQRVYTGWSKDSFEDLDENLTNTYVTKYFEWFAETSNKIRLFVNLEIGLDELIEVQYHSWKHLGQGYPIRFHRNHYVIKKQNNDDDDGI